MKISEILRIPEGKTLEFKREISYSQGLLRTLTAFANTAGGKIIIGVDDKTHMPIGVLSPLDEEERLTNIVADGISPRLVPNIELVTLEGKTLIVVEVFLSNSRPHYLTSKGLDEGVYVRLSSTNRQADRELIAELRRSVEGASFDSMPMADLMPADLDNEAIQRAFSGIRVINDKTLLTLKLIVRNQGKNVPTRGGILLFGQNRTDYYPDCWIQCGRFIGKDKARIFDHTEIEEPLPLAVDAIMMFLKKHAMRSADFSGIRRKDVWSIPLSSLREAVINALVHADYSQRGGPVRVAFFDDRIEIENPGILPPGITVEDMRQGVSRVRNPVIARVFRELRLIEQWGSGVPRIFSETATEGFPEPIINELGLRFRFTFPLAKVIEIPRIRPESQPEIRPESLEERILVLLDSGRLSKSELADRLGQKTISGQLNKVIRHLLKEHRIEYTIPQKPNSRMQKYKKA